MRERTHGNIKSCQGHARHTTPACAASVQSSGGSAALQLDDLATMSFSTDALVVVNKAVIPTFPSKNLLCARVSGPSSFVAQEKKGIARPLDLRNRCGNRKS